MARDCAQTKEPKQEQEMPKQSQKPVDTGLTTDRVKPKSKDNKNWHSRFSA